MWTISNTFQKNNKKNVINWSIKKTFCIIVNQRVNLTLNKLMILIIKQLQTKNFYLLKL